MSPPAEPTVELATFLVALVAQRAGELALSARNTRRLVARGAREYGAAHYPWIVALHVLFLASLVAEFAVMGARPGPLWPFWLAACVAAQALRVASMRALGERWTTRVWVVPGEPPVRGGIYRWLRHPNYLAVAIEMAAAPMLFGAWRTALLFSALDLVALDARVRTEERALREAAARDGGSQAPALTRP